MSLYCLKCKKYAYKTHKCTASDLISVTENMIPVANIIDGIGLKVASAFCLTNTNSQVEAGVYFKCIYPEALLQDLSTGWYWTDYIAMDGVAICSCIAYEADYINTGAMSLDEFVEGVINDLIRYLKTRDKNGLRSIMLLSDS